MGYHRVLDTLSFRPIKCTQSSVAAGGELFNRLLDCFSGEATAAYTCVALNTNSIMPDAS